MLHRFVTDLDRHLEGVPDEDGLLQAIRPAQERFRWSIRQTAPNFRPFERAHKGKRHLRKASFIVREEGQAWEGEDSEDELTDKEDGGEEGSTNSGEDEEGEDVENDSTEDDGGNEANGEVVLEQKAFLMENDKIFIDEVAARANRWVLVPSNSPCAET